MKNATTQIQVMQTLARYVDPRVLWKKARVHILKILYRTILNKVNFRVEGYAVMCIIVKILAKLDDPQYGENNVQV